MLFFKKMKKGYVYTPRRAKYNGIIYFVLSAKLRKEIGFPWTLLNTIISANSFFLRFSEKVPNLT